MRGRQSASERVLRSRGVAWYYARLDNKREQGKHPSRCSQCPLTTGSSTGKSRSRRPTRSTWIPRSFPPRTSPGARGRSYPSSGALGAKNHDIHDRPDRSSTTTAREHNRRDNARLQDHALRPVEDFAQLMSKKGPLDHVCVHRPLYRVGFGDPCRRMGWEAPELIRNNVEGADEYKAKLVPRWESSAR